VIGVASQERRQGEGEEAVLGPSDEHGVPIRASAMLAIDTLRSMVPGCLFLVLG